MRVRFLEYVKWGDLIFEEGGVYDLDEMFLARLQRDYKIEPAKDIKEVVEQPEAPVAFKPVATIVEPLPDIDLAKPLR